MRNAFELRVLFDARALGESSGFRGIGTYQRHLLRGLADQRGVGVTVLATPGTAVPAGIEVAPIRRRAPGRFAAMEHELLLPLSLRRARGDLFHSAAPDAPWRCAMPWVQTLYDTIPLGADGSNASGPRRRYRRQGARYRDAGAVIAISQHAADEGIRLLDLDPRRVHVVWLGVDSAFHPDGGTASEPPYLLVVAEHERRKRLEHAFEVIGRLAEHGYPHRLRVAGRVAPWLAAGLGAAVAASRRPDRIDILGHVDDLPALYRGATALLHTSSHEGFGFPLVEAMASGTAVVAYENSAVPEILGGAGALVADADIDAFVAATRAIIDDRGRREELRAAGVERSASFSWEACVAAHVAAYREVRGG